MSRTLRPDGASDRFFGHRQGTNEHLVEAVKGNCQIGKPYLCVVFGRWWTAVQLEKYFSLTRKNLQLESPKLTVVFQSMFSYPKEWMTR